MSTLDVGIIGAGPAGLAAAIECERRGFAYAVFEKGTLVDSIRNPEPCSRKPEIRFAIGRQTCS